MLLETGWTSLPYLLTSRTSAYQCYHWGAYLPRRELYGSHGPPMFVTMRSSLATRVSDLPVLRAIVGGWGNIGNSKSMKTCEILEWVVFDIMPVVAPRTKSAIPGLCQMGQGCQEANLPSHSHQLPTETHLTGVNASRRSLLQGVDIHPERTTIVFSANGAPTFHDQTSGLLSMSHSV